MIPDSLLMVANHLWQSTLFAGAAGLLTLALRKNSARVRYWVWVAASLKFLVPFSMLVVLGSHFHPRNEALSMPTNLTIAMDQVSQPFRPPQASSPLLATVPLKATSLPMIVGTIWALGFIYIGCLWCIRWRRLAAAVRAGSPLQLDIPIKAVSSQSFLEPGVFGLFRPVLLLPEGIFEHLTSEQWRTVLAHELCHIRHQDNLIGALQMSVETVFWFHPLVWWLGKRIFHERERGCDEEVLRLGSGSKVYAQSILRVCELYLESPGEWVSGVNGANLKTRIQAILSDRVLVELDFVRKAVLATVSVAALAAPIAVGVIHVPLLRAQSNPAFEVASIKRNNSGNANSGGRMTPQGVSIRNVTVKDLIMSAFQLRDFQLSAGPGWISSERYDLEAKPPTDTTDPKQVLFMVQRLLHERFGLELHRETKLLPVFELTVAKGGIKLKEDSSCINLEPGQKLEPGHNLAESCGYNMLGRGRFDATSMSMGDSL